jgi:hypothetical protein
MAKRTRYPGRPGTTRPAIKASGSKPATPAARSGGLTETELARAAELEAEIRAREQAAISDNARRRVRTGGLDVAIAGNASVPLSVRAAHEYAYVARDVRRIGLTAGLVFGILALIWIVATLGGVAVP